MLLICLLVALGLGSKVLALPGEVVYYVEPADESSICKDDQECHTLEYYANQSERYFHNPPETTTISLIFMSGHHASNATLEMFGINFLHFYRSNEESDITIACDFILDNINALFMNDINIDGEANQITMRNITTLVIENVNFSNGNSSSGSGNPHLTIHTSCTKITIRKCTFKDYYVAITLLECLLGNPFFNSLDIETSALSGPDPDNSTGNILHTPYGLLSLTITKTSATITGCNFTGSGYSGIKATLMNQGDLNLTNCVIQENHMCGVHILTSGPDNKIHLENTIVRGNLLPDVSSGNPYQWSVPNAAGVSVTHNAHSQSIYQITMENATFENNQDENAVPKTLFIYRSENVSISNSRFIDNYGTAIAVYLTRELILSGKTEFINNYGYEGGALLMFTVFLTIADNANINFQENRVENVGGAICIRNMPIQIDIEQPCFYQFRSPRPNATVVFNNNTAKKGGLHIYGATTKSPCNKSLSGTEQGVEFTIPNTTFSFYPPCNESLSCVSSSPIRICLCENRQTKCADIEYIFHSKTVYPGEPFTLSAAVVGADFGAVAGSVFATLVDQDSSLSDFQYAQRIDQPIKCHDLNYTIHSREGRKVQMSLSSDASALNQWYNNKRATNRYIKEFEDRGVIDINLLSTTVYVDLTINKCPSGFELNETTKVCDCHPKVKKIDPNASCYFKDGKAFIKRMKNVWLAPTNFSDENSPLSINTNCPSYKCSENHVNLSNPDVQCGGNRSGVICGKCKEGYSKTLGSSDCAKCKNNYSLAVAIIVFIVSGFLLVLFIKLLNLTVANGLLHGIIFYCNVVWINTDVLLPYDSKGTEFLQVFIASFNLDISLNVCFFDGLDAYIKTWHQFLYPTYVWCISIVLIVISKRVNILGNNGVPILLTLFLLSYSKILTTIVAALEYTEIMVVKSHNVIEEYSVWAADGNLLYAKGKHIPLFIVALLALIFIVIPYTLFLLFSRHLYKITHPRVSRWVNKLKPVIDAHSGPFKDKKEYWIGVLLLVRVILIVTPLLYGVETTLKNLGLILILSALLLYKSHIGPIYKNKFLSLLENFLIYNAIALACIAMIPPNLVDFPLSKFLAYTLVGIVFVTFLIISVRQVLIVTRIKERLAKRCSRIGRRLELELDQNSIGESILFRERSDLI